MTCDIYPRHILSILLSFSACLYGLVNAFPKSFPGVLPSLRIDRRTDKVFHKEILYPWAILPFPDNCTGWGCRVQTGILPGGAGYVRLRNVCIGQRFLHFVPTSGYDEETLRSRLFECCNVTDLNMRHVATPRGGTHCLGMHSIKHAGELCQHNMGLYDMVMRVGNWSDYGGMIPEFLPNTTWWLDTAVCDWHQFKHTTAKFVQYAMLGRSFSHLLMNRVDHLPGAFAPLAGREGKHGEAIFNFTVLPDIVAGRSVLHMGGAQPRVPLTCVSDIFTLLNYEQMHFSMQQGLAWRALLTSALGVKKRKCPPPRAALLSRSSKDGAARGFSNVKIIDQVAAEFGILHVDRISIGADNTSSEHVNLFSSFGLLFTGHSSQLTNLIFSHPNTAVIEIVGNFLDRLPMSPFEVGMKELNIIYEVSRGHSTNISSCSQCDTGDKNAVVTVVEEKLRSSLARALIMQARVCPNLPWKRT